MDVLQEYKRYVDSVGQEVAAKLVMAKAIDGLAEAVREMSKNQSANTDRLCESIEKNLAISQLVDQMQAGTKEIKLGLQAIANTVNQQNGE